MPTWLKLAFLCSITIPFLIGQAALATRLPSGLSDSVLKQFSNACIRLDASIETSKGDLYLPLLPQSSPKKAAARLQVIYPSESKPDLLVYSNGWCFLKLEKKGSQRILRLPYGLPEKMRSQILGLRFPFDLIVPEHLLVARSLKPVTGDISVNLIDDAKIAEVSTALDATAVDIATKRGGIFVTSPSSGTLTLLDDSSITKLAEFSTDGTPSGMAFANGKLYITDQSKSRILILDPQNRQFLGQIELPRKSAPKGLATLPNGKLLYVCQSAINSVAVIETATDKVLLSTKVPAGPSRMAITPNGNFLVVLNPPASQATIMSTFNQRVLGTLHLEAMPSNVAISKDSQYAFVSNRVSNTVSIIDLTKRQVINSITTGQGPTGVALSADGKQLFVANAKENTIGIYELTTRKKLKEVKLPIDIDFPGNLLMLADGTQLLVTSESTDSVGILDTKKLAFDRISVIGHSSDELIWVPID